ncbi:oxidoreductase [Oscillatoriales cyanobacterium USR001]|nr:oxidoreductase [Oscillatoriales cyanobacterium USR001]
MLDDLTAIENPFLRGMTAAIAAGSIATIGSGMVIGLVNLKGESVYKTVLCTSLLVTGGGGVFGFVYSKKGKQGQTLANDTMTPPQKTQEMDRSGWQDWRNFVVERKVEESQEITSFYLQPEDKGEIPNFQPGQFLTIKLDIPQQSRPTIRTYSLSDYSSSGQYYRLSIKREPAPKGLEVPPGVASNFMHDRIQQGSIIPAKPPSGKFALEVHQSIPIVLVSNGVGITPMLAMAKATTLLNPQRQIWFFHGARDGSFHAFRDEMQAIAQQNPNLTLHYAYSKPRPEDEGHYHSTGYVDVALIQSLVKLEAEYFLCGSPPFMDSIRTGLKQAGVPDSRVFFEMFTKASKATVEITSGSSPSPETVKSPGSEIVLSKSEKTFSWQGNADSLLEFLEANNVNPDYSCRQGICGTCECRLVEGEVEYQQTPTASVAEGSVLICIAKPKTTKVVLDL